MLLPYFSLFDFDLAVDSEGHSWPISNGPYIDWNPSHSRFLMVSPPQFDSTAMARFLLLIVEIICDLDLKS